MLITRRWLYSWLLLFVPYLCFQLYLQYSQYQHPPFDPRNALNDYVGATFRLGDFLDIQGQATALDFTTSDVTIIDIWHRACPPCLTEMRQFAALLNGQEKQVSVVSISANSYAVWKPLFAPTEGGFEFLKTAVPNWKHVVLKSQESPRLKNAIPRDNIERLADAYRTNSFPTYFVVDKNGTILTTPSSAVDYIKEQILHQRPASIFLMKRQVWETNLVLLPGMFIQYSGGFWICALIVLAVRKKVTARHPNKLRA